MEQIPRDIHDRRPHILHTDSRSNSGAQRAAPLQPPMIDWFSALQWFSLSAENRSIDQSNMTNMHVIWYNTQFVEMANGNNDNWTNRHVQFTNGLFSCIFSQYCWNVFNFTTQCGDNCAPHCVVKLSRVDNLPQMVWMCKGTVHLWTEHVYSFNFGLIMALN